MAKYKCYNCGKEKEQKIEPFILRDNILLCYSCFMDFVRIADKNPLQVINEYKKELQDKGIKKMELKKDGLYINGKRQKILNKGN